jgi:hypothetical protein
VYQGLHATSSYCFSRLANAFFYLDDQGTNSLATPVSSISIETLFACNVKKFSWREALMFFRRPQMGKTFSAELPSARLFGTMPKI